MSTGISRNRSPLSPVMDGGIRKKMRKGTHSCFECRRRKIRCIYLANNSNVCTECFSRGSKCIDQEHADPSIVVDHRKNLRERVARLENLLDMLLDERGREQLNLQSLKGTRSNSLTLPLSPASGESNQQSQSPETVYGLFHQQQWPQDEKPVISNHNVNHTTNHGANHITATPHASHSLLPNGATTAATTTDSTTSINDLNAVVSETYDFFMSLPKGSTKSKDQRVCKLLIEALPPTEILQKALDSTSDWWTRMAKSMMDQPGGIAKELTCIYAYTKWALSSGRPLEIAKVLQFHMGSQCEVDELEKYLKLIEELIIEDDEYMGELSGVEVALHQAQHYTEIGKIRRSWLTTRRALSFAQLMGLHRNRVNVRQDFVFWGLFQFDRFASLMLGSPYMVNDKHCTMTFKGKDLSQVVSNDGFMTRLGLIAGKVLDRVQGTQDNSFSALLIVDQELTSLGAQMPAEFWETSSQAPEDFAEAQEWFQDTISQMMYHNIRMLLHLPFLLRSVTSAGFEYSREACISSARNILRNFGALRLSTNMFLNRVRGTDFLALIAATILVMGLIGDVRPSASTPSSVSAAAAAVASSTSAVTVAATALQEQRRASDAQKQMDQMDWDRIDKTLETYRRIEKRTAGKIALQCRRVLEKLREFRNPNRNPDEVGRVIIPFFGTISVQVGAIRHAYDLNHQTGVASHRTGRTSASAVAITQSVEVPSAISNSSTYGTGLGGQLAYNGVYMQHSPYDHDNYMSQSEFGMSDQPYAGYTPVTPNYLNVGTFDLDSDWNCENNMGGAERFS